MISKKILRITAIVVCLAFITLSFSGVVNAADKKVRKPSVKTLLEKPRLLLSAVYSLLLGPKPLKADSSSNGKGSSIGTVKTTGNLKADRLANQD